MQKCFLWSNGLINHIFESVPVLCCSWSESLRKSLHVEYEKGRGEKNVEGLWKSCAVLNLMNRYWLSCSGSLQCDFQDQKV